MKQRKEKMEIIIKSNTTWLCSHIFKHQRRIFYPGKTKVNIIETKMNDDPKPYEEVYFKVIGEDNSFLYHCSPEFFVKFFNYIGKT
jgi:hypothetical protein